MIDIYYKIEFWTGILRDHAEFQYNSLAPTEVDAINTAMQFMELFERYHDKVVSSDRELVDKDLEQLITENKEAVAAFIEFKKELLIRLMTCDIALAMSPTFLNHMINEAFEFYRVLTLADQSLREHEVLENLRLHKVWLPDASGHAKHIASQLDGIEEKHIKKALEFEKKFDGCFKKSYEMYIMFERTNLDDGALQQLNMNVEECMNEFIQFLIEIRSLLNDCRIYSTGTFTSLVPDHMIREEKYYLYKVNQYSK